MDLNRAQSSRQGEPDRSPRGLTFKQIPDCVLRLPTAQRSAGIEVWAALHYFLRRGATELTTTDRELTGCPFLQGRSAEFTRKGLEALEGLGMIARRKSHGLRTIAIVGRLRTSVKPARTKDAPALPRLTIVRPQPVELSPEELETLKRFFPRAFGQIAQ